jgi:serine/threonine protein kinase
MALRAAAVCPGLHRRDWASASLAARGGRIAPHPEASAGSFLVNPAADAVDDPLTQNSEPPPAGLEPGVSLGAYRIERPLGRGGMGVVFLAHDTTLHRKVALKVLRSATENGTARDRLLREARNAAALNHPNICTVYEVGEATDRAFIAMEYVDGQSLTDRLRNGPLPLDEVPRYGIEAADALAYAHDHGVVHRDFKAATLRLQGQGAQGPGRDLGDQCSRSLRVRGRRDIYVVQRLRGVACRSGVCIFAHDSP